MCLVSATLKLSSRTSVDRSFLSFVISLIFAILWSELFVKDAVLLEGKPWSNGKVVSV